MKLSNQEIVSVKVITMRRQRERPECPFAWFFSLAFGGYGSHLVQEIGFRELGSSENPS